MSGLLENVQPAVKKETKRVVMITGAGLILMWILFAILHFTMPDKVPFDYTVILGGIGGGVIAVLNFFLMGLAVQKAASATDEGTFDALALNAEQGECKNHAGILDVVDLEELIVKSSKFVVKQCRGPVREVVGTIFC